MCMCTVGAGWGLGSKGAVQAFHCSCCTTFARRNFQFEIPAALTLTCTCSPALLPPSHPLLQNTDIKELLWMFWILVLLLLVTRAAFVFPVSLLHNRFAQHRLEYREMITIWWVGSTAAGIDFVHGSSGGEGRRAVAMQAEREIRGFIHPEKAWAWQNSTGNGRD